MVEGNKNDLVNSVNDYTINNDSYSINLKDHHIEKCYLFLILSMMCCR
ncbi:hypothetical protein NTGHW29_320032 [Candidatus Nitrotoga sp. HW29]|nr:hypothetical protein NTGHW29_320032 [Candidatus Nitrotoga sp. HW29]